MRVENTANLESYLLNARPLDYWYYPHEIQDLEKTWLLPENWEKCSVMSNSNFELIDKQIKGEDTSLTEAAAIAVIKGKAGHEISYIVTSLVRDWLSHNLTKEPKRINSISSCRPELKQHEREAIDASAFSVLGEKKIAFQDIPEAAYDIWQDLRDKYFFYKKPTNSKRKPIYGGDICTPEWVAWQWNLSSEHQSFEESVLDIHIRRINNFVSQDYSQEKNGFLPLEWSPSYYLTIEDPSFFVVAHKNFRSQIKGQTDYRLNFRSENFNETIIIDQKFSDPLNLESLPNRLQVLAYSLGVKKHKDDWENKYLDPSGVRFFYEIYDFENADHYYIDATITPDELPYLAEKFVLYCMFRYADKERIDALIEKNKRNIVMPHIPYPDELEKYYEGNIENILATANT